VIAATDLLDLGRGDLMELLRGGHPIDRTELADRRYRGISLGLPGWVEALTWKKFGKCFAAHDDGRIRGWNLRIVQDGLEEPWTAMRCSDGTPRTFGHFEVVPAAEHPTHQGITRGLLIHYGRGHNGRFDPVSLLRDPLVALNPEDSTLLLGWSYVDLGLGIRLGTPSFFSLELDGPLQHRPQGTQPSLT